MHSQTYKVNPETYSRCPEHMDEPQANLKEGYNTACMLSGLRLFSHLPLHERKRISARITPQRFVKGEHILYNGDEDRNVYFVISGQVRAI